MPEFCLCPARPQDSIACFATACIVSRHCTGRPMLSWPWQSTPQKFATSSAKVSSAVPVWTCGAPTSLSSRGSASTVASPKHSLSLHCKALAAHAVPVPACLTSLHCLHTQLKHKASQRVDSLDHVMMLAGSRHQSKGAAKEAFLPFVSHNSSCSGHRMKVITLLRWKESKSAAKEAFCPFCTFTSSSALFTA